MAFPKAISLPTAIEGRSNIELSSKHVTTSDWLQFNVSKYLMMVPKQSIDVRHIPFQRLQPMPVPTFGRGKFVHRAYFVPFRTVWTAWDDFYNGVPHSYDNGTYVIPSFAPSMYNRDLVIMFLKREFSQRVEDDSAYDFQLNNVIDDGMSQQVNYNFTPLGRFAYKMLRSLGYSVNFINTDDAPNGMKYTELKNALKLLCVAKVYCDHYFPQQYANTEDAIWLNSYFINNNDLWNDPGAGSLLADDLARIFRCLYRLPYGSDYFTSAWDNPVSPNNDLYPSTLLSDFTDGLDDGFHNSITNNNNLGTPLVSETGAPGDYVQSLSKYALTALNRMTDYVKRMQLVGSRVIDRFFARFGIKLSNEALKRSVKLAEYSENIAFADVTAMASTDSATLGDYAGKGISSRGYDDAGRFQYTATEHGMIIIISINVPEISYYQGEHRDSHDLSRLDFWNPEFDALGVQALSLNELYSPIDGKELVDSFTESYTDQFNKRVFGFTPRYAQYKIPYDQITGDYILRSKGVGVDSWYLARDVKPFFGGDIDQSHSLDFVMSDDKQQYNRIFNNVADSADHFNVVHYFEIKSSFPGKSLFDTYEFENEDKAEKVVVNINGSTESN